MSEFSDQLLRKPVRESWFSRFQVLAIAIITLVAILSQVYIPRFIPYIEYLELPLLLTVYFGLMRRNQIAGLFFGAFVGLVQDSLSHLPIGMFGIAKTLVGYFAASISMRFDVDNIFIRLILSFFFYLFHAFLYWMMTRALLGQMVPLDPQGKLVYGLLNAVVAVPLFLILDKMKLSGS